MKKLVLTSIFLILFFTPSVPINLSEIVQTNKGPVRGEILKTVINSVKYTAFRGIPYAKPPIGYRRFKPPQEADTWTGTLNAITDPNFCPQIRNHIYIGNEDCLYLNVYTPKIRFSSNETNDSLAVMVWIFGGGFLTGGMQQDLYGPDFLIDEGVVMVAINYRLGAFGFLSLDHANATGNAGLKDQVLGLKWVQDNIRNFGGDPKRLTIFGQSSGAVAVELHKMSDLSKGLFTNSIAMSGSPLNLWGFHSIFNAELQAFNLGKSLGLVTNSKTNLLKRLYEATAEEIVCATSNMSLAFLPFRPTYENKNVNIQDVFLSKSAIELYESGETDNQPHIMGFCDSELIFLGGFVLPFESVINDTLRYFVTIFNSTLGRIEIFTEMVNALNDSLKKTITDFIYIVVNVIADIMFVEGIDRTQQYLTATSTAPVYYYRNSFDYDMSLHRRGGLNLAGKFDIPATPMTGTGHIDDIFQIFWRPRANQSLDPTSDIGIQRIKMVKLFTNFAKYGNPTPNGTRDAFLNIEWIPSGTEGKCLEISKSLEMGLRPTDHIVEVIQQVMKLLEENLNGWFYVLSVLSKLLID